MNLQIQQISNFKTHKFKKKYNLLTDINLHLHVYVRRLKFSKSKGYTVGPQ